MTAKDNNKPEKRALSGVLITGAAVRIGRALALAFAAKGWFVHVHYNRSGDHARELVADIVAAGGQAAAIAANLADLDQVESLVPRCAAQGAITAVINSASVFEYDRPETLDMATFDQAIAVNLKAPMVLAKALYQHVRALHAMQSDGVQGAVIHILDHKLQAMNPDFCSYTLAKAALAQGVVMGAQAFAPYVRVNGISPGLTVISPLQTEAQFAAAHADTPLGYGNTPENIAQTALYLTSCASITGQNIVVDAGVSLNGMPRDISC
jgi:NAD(P)-dependent dehydrogenase (short-subunit alcohol dehydrogenase family)